MSMDGKQLKNDSVPAVKIKSDLAGAGLGSTSGALSVNTNQGLEVSGDNVRISATGSVTHTGGVHTHTVDTLQVTGTPNSANDPVNKATLDSTVEGRAWKQPAEVKDYLGSRTVVQINGLTPVSGQSVVAADGGTPSAGTSDILVAGDVAEFDGTQWKKIVSASGGFVPDGTRLLIHDETVTLFAPLTDGTDESKFADFDGTSLTPATKTAPLDGEAILVRGNGSVNENKGYAFNTGDATWNQNDGAVITAGAGLSQSGNAFNVGAGNGITVGATDVAVNPDTATGVTVAALSITSNGAGVAIDNDTIVHDNGGPDVLSVGANSIGTAEIADGEAFAFTEATGTTETPGDNSTKLATTAYADAAGGGSSISTNEREETSAATSGNESATGITLSATPAADTRLQINGIGEIIAGDKLSAAYFSVDGGTNARALGAAVSGDELIWNGTVAGYELAASDIVSLLYEV